MIDTPARPARNVRESLPEIATLVGFTLTMAVTQRAVAAVSVALVLGVAAVGLRLRRRRSPWQAVVALGIVAIGTVLVLVSGQAENFFLPSLVIHAVIASTVITLVVVGRPPLGLLFGSPAGRATGWRACRIRHRAYRVASLVMAIPPLMMLAGRHAVTSGGSQASRLRIGRLVPADGAPHVRAGPVGLDHLEAPRMPQPSGPCGAGREAGIGRQGQSPAARGVGSSVVLSENQAGAATPFACGTKSGLVPTRLMLIV